MKYLYKILLLALILSPTTDIYGVTAKFNKIWLDHGVKFENRNAMKVNISFSVQNGKGEDMCWCLWLVGPDGNWHPMKNAKKNSKGISYRTASFTPPYFETVYNNSYCYLCIDDLNLTLRAQ